MDPIDDLALFIQIPKITNTNSDDEQLIIIFSKSLAFMMISSLVDDKLVEDENLEKYMNLDAE